MKLKSGNRSRSLKKALQTTLKKAHVGPYVIAEDMVDAVETKISEDRRFTITTFLEEFHQVPGLVLYKTVTLEPKFQEIVLLMDTETPLN